MCQIGSKRSGTHYLRFRSMERKIYRVRAFCGHRFHSYAAMRLPCPAMQPGQGNWFTQIPWPASPDEYAVRAAELGVVPVPHTAAWSPHRPCTAPTEPEPRMTSPISKNL